jgi:hypothetical protein
MNTEALSLRQLTRIQEDAEEQIIELKEKYRQQPTRMLKNCITMQISNRERIITRAKTLITNKSQS